MLPDIPANCPICASAPSHDAPKVGTLQGRVYQCGAVVCNLDEGEWEVTLYCEKTGEMLDGLRTEVSRLRADNVRLGDRNVLFAIATQAAIDDLELALRMWATRPLDLLPRETLLKLAPLRAAYDELVDVLEGAAPTPAAEAAPVAPDHGLTGVEQTSAAEHVGERSLDTP